MQKIQLDFISTVSRFKESYNSSFSKKLMSLVLAMAMIVTSFSGISHASPNSSNKEVYVDGVKFVVSIVNWEIKVQSVGTKEIAKMQIDKFGNGTIQGVKELSKGEIAQVDINKLDSNNIDVEISSKNKVVTEFKSMSTLKQDVYTGQDVIVGGIIVVSAAVLQALIAAALVITIAGVMCYAVEGVLDDLKRNQKYYYDAQTALNTVVINPIPISLKVASERIKSGLSIYTFNNNLALSAVVSAGLGYVGPENHYEPWKFGKFYDHYHTAGRNGAHAWFGIAR